MRMPFGWSQTSFHALCACCALWGAPATAALAVPEQLTPTPALSTPTRTSETSTANNSIAHAGDFSFNRHVLKLLAMGCLVGVCAGWVSRGPRKTGVRLLSKPKKKHLPVLVPPGPTPRLVPGDAPNATRARGTHDSTSRKNTFHGTHSGLIDYIAVFADPAKASERSRVDYLLVSGDSVDEPLDSPEEH